ncbi:MAG: glycoside hydrolase family 25 protein [Ruminococcus sp.]|nr:glycoside hydrolase family 25 protein [Ruminococcus sp.]
MSLTGKKGVDVSSCNGDISIEAIKKAGYDFVMIRCGYGSDYASQDDTQFENNVRKCEKAGVPWGAYLYSYALGTEDAKSEARHVIRLLKGKRPTLPVAIDIEDADGYHERHGGWNFKTINAVTKTFIEEIRKAGYYPMLYTGFEELDNLISPEVANSVDIWFAQWWKTCDYKGKNLGMWQYGGETNYLDSPTIPGVGVIDQDKCYKDYPTIIKNGGYNGWKKSDKVLDTAGYKYLDKGTGVLALKEMLLFAKRLGITTQGMDENGTFGDGTQIAVNQVLKKGGYEQNGIAGDNFIKYLAKLIKAKL